MTKDSSYFDGAGFPIGGSWDEIDLPGAIDQNAYAVEIQGDSMQPIYRAGDILIVSPSTSVRDGDRVLVKTSDAQIMARRLEKYTPKRVTLATLDGRETYDLEASRIDWIARILWAPQ
jgi:phage repressor protein C with HTH and peptisase S24 domain